MKKSIKILTFSVLMLTIVIGELDIRQIQENSLTSDLSEERVLNINIPQL